MTSKVPGVDCTNRDMSVNPRMLRRNGRIPATIYGHNLSSVSIEVDKKSFTYLYFSQNPNLIVLNINDDKTRALIKKVQVHPVSSEILNVEFLQVREDEVVTLSVPLVLENEAPAIKKGGILWQLMDEIDIECLPKDIPDNIIFDISVLEDLDTAVTIADLKYPSGVKPTLPPETPIVRVSSPKETVEEEAPAAGAAEPALVGEE